jgi:hypothetical protein
MGEPCFDIPNPRKSFSNPRRFCVACFKLIVVKTKGHIAEIEAGMA